jgi:hypothetical protein
VILIPIALLIIIGLIAWSEVALMGTMEFLAGLFPHEEGGEVEVIEVYNPHGPK